MNVLKLKTTNKSYKYTDSIHATKKRQKKKRGKKNFPKNICTQEINIKKNKNFIKKKRRKTNNYRFS